MYRRDELIEELTSEQTYIKHMLKLHFIDDEFHRASRSNHEYFESAALHGYRTLLWTQDARNALAREQSRLVASLVVTQVIDGILSWMLEGWYFGERQSQYHSVGYVPSIGKQGRLLETGTEENVSECL